MLVVAVPAAPPVKPAPAGTGQVYVVPAGTTPSVPSAGVRLNEPPLQIVAVSGLIAGAGLMVTVTVNVLPVQVPVCGVTVYVAVLTELVVFNSVPPILAAPLPAAPPLNPA